MQEVGAPTLFATHFHELTALQGPVGVANMHVETATDAATGKLKWSHSIDARYNTVIAGLGPRATPTIDDGFVYALGGTAVLRNEPFT